MTLLHHSTLGQIRGIDINNSLTQFRSIPYGTVKQRFARSKLLDQLPHQNASEIYDATKVGPSSIQPFGAAKMDADSNQLPSDIVGDDQEQSEDCLRVTITVPTASLPSSGNSPDSQGLPVLVFLHGGAFFLNSGERPYYSPENLVSQAITSSMPLVFVSVNYRLGALGFFHSSEAPDLIPANNGLHDQVRAFEWIERFISGFGGSSSNITAIGQSAGGESLSLHNISGGKTPLYNRSITLAGTPVTMPAKTPAEHEESFRAKAKEVKIDVGDGRSSVDIANDMIHRTPVDAIRDLSFVGAPCTSSEILPYKRPTMELSRSGPETTVPWLESQVTSAAGYDGSISWIITKKNPKRNDHASSFRRIAEEVLGDDASEALCKLYELPNGNDSPNEKEDDDVLTKICQFESDIGFVCAAEAVAEGSAKKNIRTYLQLFDLPNPFEGYLEAGKFSTHSWDIVAFLGAYDDRLNEQYLKVIKAWRSRLIEYCVNGKEPWTQSDEGRAMFVSKEGLDVRAMDALPGSGRRLQLSEIAKIAAGEKGHDLLWEGVCRRWLDKGE